MKFKFLSLMLSILLCIMPAGTALADTSGDDIAAVDPELLTVEENQEITVQENDNTFTVKKDKKGRISGNGLLFSIMTDEEGKEYAAVTGRKGSSTDISIPENILLEDVPYEVLEIADLAFPYTDIISVSIPETVESIGNMAFLGCSALTSVTIPKNCEYIGYGAFMDCVSLCTVDFNNSVCKLIGEFAFYDTALTEVEISDLTETLGDCCFSNCDYLKSFRIGASCENIGIGVFSYDYSLEKITKSKYNKKIKIVKGCIYSSDGKKLISGATAKGKLVLEKGLEEIYPFAFESNDKIKTVTVPGTVKVIPEGCFMLCSSLKKVTLKNGVKSLESGSFYANPKLTGVTVPKSVKKMIDNPFMDCAKLSNIVIAAKNKNFTVRDGIVMSKDLKTVISAPAVSGTLKLNSECRTIGNNAFAYNNSIEKIYFNEGLKSVGLAAFYCCSKLNYVYMPSRSVMLCEDLENNGAMSGLIFSNCGEQLEISVPFGVEAGAKGSLEDTIDDNCNGNIMVTQH